MSKPRYSIIPAGAVTDPRLEGRDLQVLCLLGCHTDKLGWCYRTQGEVADDLGCSRSTVQRSLKRLLDAEWIATRSSSVTESGRPYAAYAYRVLMDRDDPEIAPTMSEVTAQIQEGGCPRVGTVPTGGQGVPIQDGHGVPTHTSALIRPSKLDQDSESESRARDGDLAEAFEVTKQIATIAGIGDAMAWPPGWKDAATRVDQFLRDGYSAEGLLMAAREVMASRRDPEPPWSVEYFARAFAKVRARREKPLPVVQVQTEPQKVMIDGKSRDSGFKGALGKLDDAIRERECGISQGSQAPVRLISDGRRERS